VARAAGPASADGRARKVQILETDTETVSAHKAPASGAAWAPGTPRAELVLVGGRALLSPPPASLRLPLPVSLLYTYSLPP
jgi:hypothetical protein